MDAPPILPPGSKPPQPKKRKRGKKIFIFGGIGLVLIVIVLVLAFSKREIIITVQSEKVTRRNITEIVTANGRIQPVLQVKISPEVSGEIIELPVKEGQKVKKGDLLVKIKQDTYLANQNQAEASYKSALAGETTAAANLARAEAEFKRNEELFQRKLISDSAYFEFKTSLDVARANLISATNQGAMSHAALARAREDLAKTVIVAPLDATVSKLNSQSGERVVGTAMMTGTEIMTLADLNEMEARVDIGEMDVVLMAPGQIARLEVDAFKDRKFSGAVTEVANSSKNSGFPSGGGGNQQDATKFEVKIRIKEKEQFRPGMSVTAEIETRYRTNTLTVPIASVTTRMKKEEKKSGANAVAAATNSVAVTNSVNSTNFVADSKSDRKSKEGPKVTEVVFLVNSDHAKMAPVKIGISDDTHWEITEGLKEGDEVISGGFRAVSRDLEDGKKIRKGAVGAEDVKKKEP